MNVSCLLLILGLMDLTIRSHALLTLLADGRLLPSRSFAIGAGKGFANRPSNNQGSGKKTKSSPAKTYGSGTFSTSPIIDVDGAMSDFFQTRSDWAQLFRSISVDDCLAAPYIGKPDTNNELEFNDANYPWRKLEGLPSDEGDKEAISKFLDNMQQSLLDIQVSGSKEEDDDDLQFLEEARRILTISRFHVLKSGGNTNLQSYDDLFRVVWSELHYLSSTATVHSGSLILTPDYNLKDLEDFADLNLLKPLQWLGLHADFEIATFERNAPAIRMIYRLKDMPESPSNAQNDDVDTNL